ncbi:MAG: HYR domain-containing protein, partial [Proteobacteria bacterium]|nr:HYR domain-containing protein [Pseudomonadota bacterium]
MKINWLKTGLPIIGLMIGFALSAATPAHSQIEAELVQKLSTVDAVGVNNLYFGISVSISGDTALIGALHDNDNGENSGSAFIFVRLNGTWIQQAKLTPVGGHAHELFGYSVSLHGDTALISAYRDADNGYLAGAVYVFTRTGTTWTQQAKLLPNDGHSRQSFGQSVSLKGNTALIGAHNDGGVKTGAAYIFTRSGSAWSQQAKLVPPESGKHFGLAVSLDENTALIGSAGSAYVFTGTGANWTQQAKLTQSDEPVGWNYFGRSVSLNGDIALIGNYMDSSTSRTAGSAYVFTRSGNTWSQQAKLTAGDPVEFGSFGQSVSLNGDTALIGSRGAMENDVRIGGAYIFTYLEGGGWSQASKIVPPVDTYTNFGYSVSLDGDTVLIGAITDGDQAQNSGAAYVFHIGGSDSDGDEVPDDEDNCPDVANPNQEDQDGDEIGDVCDNCPATSNTDQLDNDNDGTGDACENEAPVAQCKDAETALNAGGNATISASGVDNGSYDPDSDPITFGLSKTDFICSDIGTQHAVTLTVTDDGGLSDSCAATVTAIDNLPPAPDTDPLPQVTGECSATVTATPTATDNCAGTVTGTTNDLLNYSDQGNYAVTWSFDDGNGNIANQSQNIVVSDSTEPDVQTKNITVQLNVNGTASITADQVNNGSSDACGIFSMSVSPSSFTCADVGPNQVTLTVTDNNGNSREATAIVTVVDILPPVPNAASLPQVTGQCSATIPAAPTATDNCAGTVTGTTTDPLSYSAQGTYTVTWTFDDGNGNTAIQTQQVVVKDNTPPSVQTQNITVELAANGQASITASQINNGSIDNCGIASMSVSPSSFTCADIGDNTVTLTVIDVNGNSSNATAIVTVQDVTPPELIVPEDITVEMQTAAGADVTLTPTASDTCDADVEITSDEPDVFPLGTTTVTFTATDDSGNSTSESMTVTVQGPVEIKENAKECLSDHTDESKQFKKAIKGINRSLNEKYWLDETHLYCRNGGKVFDHESYAVRALMRMLSGDKIFVKGGRTSGPSPYVGIKKEQISDEARACAESAIERLVRVDRILAETLILEAEETGGAGNQKRFNRQITKAYKELKKGDADRDAG